MFLYNSYDTFFYNQRNKKAMLHTSHLSNFR